MTKRECLLGTAVQAALIVFLMFGAFMIQPCQAQVDAALQRTADQIKVVWGDPVTGSANEINVGQKLRGIEALREQLMLDLGDKLERAYNKGTKLTDQEVSELRKAADKLTKLGLYCRDLADRVQQQHPESAALTDWLRANELVSKIAVALDFSGTPINQTRVISDLDDIERRGHIRSDPMLLDWVHLVRGAATADPEFAACEARKLRAILGYTPAGIGVDVFRITASAGSVAQGDPVDIGVTLSMLGEGDCQGQNLRFVLQAVAGNPPLQKDFHYFPGDQRYDQNFFTIDTKALQPGTYPVVATVYYSVKPPAGVLPQTASKTANTSFVVTAPAAGPATSFSGKPWRYSANSTAGGRNFILMLDIDFSGGSAKVVAGELDADIGSASPTYITWVKAGQAGAPDFTIMPKRNPDNVGYNLDFSGTGHFEGGAPPPGAQGFRATLSLTGSYPFNGILTFTRFQ